MLVSITSRARTPASSWVVTCALKPRSTPTRCSTGYSGVDGAHNRLSNYYTARSRQDLNIDTRTATEYGVAAHLLRCDVLLDHGSTPDRGTGATVYSGAAPVGNPADGGIAGGSLGVYHAFIQFAGFTMGKTVSQFDAPWVNYPGNNFDGLVGGSGMVTGVNQLTYTAQFGNGVSATFSVQDPTAYTQAICLTWCYRGRVPMIGPASGRRLRPQRLAGTRAPDIIVCIKVDQAWGMFQCSAVAHNNHAGLLRYQQNHRSSRTTSGAGLFRAPCRSRTSRLVRVTPSTCRLSTPTVRPATTSRAWLRQPRCSAAPALPALTRASVSLLRLTVSSAPATASLRRSRPGASAVVTTTTGTPTGTGASTVLTPPSTTATSAGPLICANPASSLRHTAWVHHCNPDFNVAQSVVITRWTPVKGLTFSADFIWTRLDQKSGYGCYSGRASTALAKPAAVYELKDQDSVNLLLRAQRNW